MPDKCLTCKYKMNCDINGQLIVAKAPKDYDCELYWLK